MAALLVSTAISPSRQFTVASQQPPPPLRSGVVLVPLDVRVVDAQGNPVRDLTASDFAVYENDLRQEIAHFERVDFEAGASLPSLPPGHPLAAASTPHRTFILVLGRGRTNGPVKGIDALIDLVRDQLLPTDRVGIVSYLRVAEPSTDHASVLRFLQHYRERHEEIEGWLDRDSGRAFGGPTMDLTDGTRRAIAALFRQPGLPAFRELPGAAEGTSIRYGTFNALRWALHDARQWPGEKHLILLSQDRIPLGRFTDDPTKNLLVRLATTARVAISFVHTGGLSGMSMLKGQVFIASAAGGDAVESMLGISDGEFFGPTDHRRLTQLTGGVAAFYRYARQPLDFVNRSSKFQYLLGYYPTVASAPDAFRRIRVVVARPGARALHRHGYQLEWSASNVVDLRRAAAEHRLRGALDWLIESRASAFTQRFPRLRRTSFKILQCEFRTAASGRLVAATLSLDPSRVAFSAEGTSHRLTLTLAIEVDGDDDAVVGEKMHDIDALLTGEEFAQTRNQWLAFDLDVPVQGTPARLRAAVYDYESDRVWYAARDVERPKRR